MITLLRLSFIEKKIRKLSNKRSRLAEKYIRKCESKWKKKLNEEN